jgi:hypothetical protein
VQVGQGRTGRTVGAQGAVWMCQGSVDYGEVALEDLGYGELSYFGIAASVASC